jgi:hypothetical protein
MVKTAAKLNYCHRISFHAIGSLGAPSYRLDVSYGVPVHGLLAPDKKGIPALVSVTDLALNRKLRCRCGAALTRVFGGENPFGCNHQGPRSARSASVSSCR